MARVHHLKIWPEFFAAIKRGMKTFEVRFDDRGYMVGDKLVLCEFDPAGETYTDREIEKKITYKMPGGKYGIDPAYCILGLGT